MRADQANNIDFPDLLSRLGHEPTAIRKGGNELWYRSPFRKEKKASFHISKGRKYAWVWKDFGDEGGTVIDFIMRLHGHRNLKKALDYLNRLYPDEVSTARPVKRVGANTQNFSEDRELEFIGAYPISNPIIYAYLEGRCIPKKLAQQYLKEIKYRHKKSGKEFFAFGMENQSSGYEIRAASDEYSFKSALKKKDITFIQGSRTGRNAVNVFEGMTDFLSLLVMLDVSNLLGDSIIMHSLSSFGHTVEFIKDKDYQQVNTFLDNNKSGKEHTRKFKDTLRI